MPHQPTMNVLSIMGRMAPLSPSASRRHNSSKQNHAPSSSKNNDYDSLSSHQRYSSSSESSHIISIKKTDMVDLTENSDLPVRGQGLDLQEICTKF